MCHFLWLGGECHSFETWPPDTSMARWHMNVHSLWFLSLEGQYNFNNKLFKCQNTSMALEGLPTHERQFTCPEFHFLSLFTPSFLNISIVSPDNLALAKACCLTFSVSNGWPTTTPAHPVLVFFILKFFVLKIFYYIFFTEMKCIKTAGRIFFKNLPPTHPAIKSHQYMEDIFVPVIVLRLLSLVRQKGRCNCVLEIVDFDPFLYHSKVTFLHPF